jgi:hypothetical protein
VRRRTTPTPTSTTLPDVATTTPSSQRSRVKPSSTTASTSHINANNSDNSSNTNTGTSNNHGNGKGNGRAPDFDFTDESPKHQRTCRQCEVGHTYEAIDNSTPSTHAVVDCPDCKTILSGVRNMVRSRGSSRIVSWTVVTDVQSSKLSFKVRCTRGHEWSATRDLLEKNWCGRCKEENYDIHGKPIIMKKRVYATVSDDDDDNNNNDNDNKTTHSNSSNSNGFKNGHGIPYSQPSQQHHPSSSQQSSQKRARTEMEVKIAQRKKQEEAERARQRFMNGGAAAGATYGRPSQSYQQQRVPPHPFAHHHHQQQQRSGVPAAAAAGGATYGNPFPRQGGPFFFPQGQQYNPSSFAYQNGFSVLGRRPSATSILTPYKTPSFFRREADGGAYTDSERRAAIMLLQNAALKTSEYLCISPSSPNVRDKKTINAHFRIMALLVHPDKTTLTGADDAFKKLNSIHKQLLLSAT